MRKRIAQALAAALFVSTVAGSPVYAKSLESMQKDKANAESEASSLQKQLTETLDKIDTLEEDLQNKEKEVAKADEDLEKAAADQTNQYEAMKLRIKYMYEDGTSSFLEAILSSTSISDFLNKAEYIQEVHSYDRNKLDEYEEATKKVEKLKTSLQDEYIQMEEMQTELEEEKESLNATLEEKQEEIASLDQSIQAEIAARQEAERKAKEEAERAEREAREAAQAAQAANQAAAQNAAANANNNTNRNTANNNQSTANNNSGSASSRPSSSAGNTGNSGNSGSSTAVKPQGKSGAAVVAYARQFLGNPYVYGGNSLTNGVDCSGFTQQIYAAFGVSLPRTDSAQATVGVEIPLSQAQAGDLLCYYGHVGIYNGAGGIIHASSPSVGIVEFSNCQYRTLRCVRRIL